MEEWLTEVQVPHGPWPDGSPELAPDEVGPVVHVRPRQSQWGPEEGEILYLVNLSKLFPMKIRRPLLILQQEVAKANIFI